MESSKMYCPSRCRYRTDQLGVRNYPVSREVVQGPEWKYAKFRPYQSPWYRVCTKAMVISKGSYGHGEFKNVLPQLVQISYLSLRGRKLPRFMGVVQGPEWKYAKFRPYQSPWYRVCTKAMVISKGSYKHGQFKNVLPQLVQISYLSLRGSKVPRFMGVVQGPEWKYAKLRSHQSPWYSVCIKTMVISKGSYGHGEFKNVLPQSVQIPYLPLRGSKVPRFMGGSIGPRMEICETSALPIYMISRLHQSNGYIKRKLRAWRVQKCIALVGADTVLTSWGPETTLFQGRQYRAQKGNMRNFGPTNPHGTAFASKQWLYKKEATGMESSKMYYHSWCRYRTYHCVAAKYPVSWGQYRAQNGNMRNFGPTNPHGTAFASKQWVHQKEATGMESSKMYCPSRCRYRTYHCVEAKYPVSWGVVQGPEWKYAQLRPFQFT